MKFRLIEETENYNIITKQDGTDTSDILMINGKMACKLDYRIYPDYLYILYIETFEGFKRQGYATKLLKNLQQKYPDMWIDPSSLTDDGQKLIKAMAPEKKKSPRYIKMKQEIARLKKEINDFYKSLGMTEEEVSQLDDTEWDELTSDIDPLYNELDDLECTLEDSYPYWFKFNL